jgi:protein-disulfide isomerase
MKSPSVTIPIAIVAGGIIVALAVYMTLHKSEPSTASNTGNPALVRPVGASDHILGNPAAPVLIVEYSDFDCSYCKVEDANLRALIAADGSNGKVAWVYRNFPLTQLHPDAFKAAEAAECVALTAGNDAYWKFTATLFASQPADPLKFAEYAVGAGADASKFGTCLANATSTVDARINADAKNAAEVGAIGTPYSLVIANGRVTRVLDGAYSYSELESAVSSAASESR